MKVVLNNHFYYWDGVCLRNPAWPWDSLRNPDCPWTFRNCPISASEVPGFQVCTSMPGYCFIDQNLGMGFSLSLGYWPRGIVYLNPWQQCWICVVITCTDLLGLQVPPNRGWLFFPVRHRWRTTCIRNHHGYLLKCMFWGSAFLNYRTKISGVIILRDTFFLMNLATLTHVRTHGQGHNVF